jgi:hypothetical protein
VRTDEALARLESVGVELTAPAVGALADLPAGADAPVYRLEIFGGLDGHAVAVVSEYRRGELQTMRRVVW